MFSLLVVATATTYGIPLPMAYSFEVVSVTAAVTACGDASAWQHATGMESQYFLLDCLKLDW